MSVSKPIPTPEPDNPMLVFMPHRDWVDNRVSKLDDVSDSLSDVAMSHENKVRLELALNRLMRSVGRVKVREHPGGSRGGWSRTGNRGSAA